MGECEQIDRISYQQLRFKNLCWSIPILLFASAIVSFATGYAQTDAALQWLPYELWIHKAFSWISTFMSSTGQALQQVMLAQVLVWWIWKRSERSQRWVGIVLLVSLGIGTALSLYGLVLGHRIVAPPGAYEITEYISQYAVRFTWTICALAISWLALKGAQPVMGICLIDAGNGDADQTSLPADRTWSIRGLMLTTLVIAAVIALYQALARFQTSSNDIPWESSMGWISLVSILTYCLVNIIVLWTAAWYRMGQSSLVGYGVLVIATTIDVGKGTMTQMLMGAAYMMPIRVSTIIESAILISVTFALHVWLFRKWEQAGYRLSHQMRSFSGG